MYNDEFIQQLIDENDYWYLISAIIKQELTDKQKDMIDAYLLLIELSETLPKMSERYKSWYEETSDVGWPL